MQSEVVVRENGSRRVIQSTVGDSMTEQSHAGEVNINEIIRRYQRSGTLPVRRGIPMYGDFSGMGDYHDTVGRVLAAQNAFQALPSELRNRFHNDPGELLEFLGDEGNRDEAVQLGLIDKPVEPVKVGNPVNPGNPVTSAPVADPGKVAQ